MNKYPIRSMEPVETLVRTGGNKGSERNRPCHCGSGKKQKKCHGLMPPAYSTAGEQARRRRQAVHSR